MYIHMYMCIYIYIYICIHIHIITQTQTTQHHNNDKQPSADHPSALPSRRAGGKGPPSVEGLQQTTISV